MIAQEGVVDGRGGRATWRRMGMALLPAAALAWADGAHALWGDRVELFAAQTVTRDDNVFRLSSQSDPASVLGTPSKADTYSTTSAGLNFDVPVSRQRFTGGLWVADNRYDQFTVLDYTEHHGRATWQWEAGSRFNGRLGYTQDRALASLANVQGGVQVSTPNPLTTQKGFFDAEVLLGARWRLRAEVSRLAQENEAAPQQVNDITDDGAGLTLKYVTPAGNQIGFGVHMQDAELPNAQLVNGILVDNSYRQRRASVVTEWHMTGHSQLRASAGWVERSFVQLPERDHATGFFRAAYAWNPSGSFTLAATAQRDIAAPDEVNVGINVGFVLVQGVALRPAYRVSDKLELSGSLEAADWDYLGDPGMALGTVPPRSDRVRAVALGIGYQPWRAVRFALALRHEERSSTAEFGDYVDQVASLSARLAF